MITPKGPNNHGETPEDRGGSTLGIRACATAPASLAMVWVRERQLLVRQVLVYTSRVAPSFPSSEMLGAPPSPARWPASRRTRKAR
jgi:hypothetical protein